MSTEVKPAAKSTALAPSWDKPTTKSGLEALAPMVKAQLERGLPAFMQGQGDRLLRCLLTETQKTPALMDCTPISLFAACIQAGQLGLTIGGPTGEAYLLPFNNRKSGVKEATLVPGYKGYVQLAYRSGKIRRLSPGVVRMGDDFGFERGTAQWLKHVPKRDNPGKVVHYYVVVELVNSGTDFEEFSFEDAIKFRDRYATTKNYKSGPWYAMDQDGEPTDDFHGMALKTLIRRLSKRLPLSAEMVTAGGLEDQDVAGVPQNLGAMMLPEYIPVAPTATQRLEEKVNGKPTAESEKPTPAAEDGDREPESVAEPPKSPPPPAKPAKKAAPAARETPEKPQDAPQKADPPPAPPVAPKTEKAPPRVKSAVELAIEQYEAAGGDVAAWLMDMSYDSVATLLEDASDLRKKRLVDSLQTKTKALAEKKGLFTSEGGVEPEEMEAIRR